MKKLLALLTIPALALALAIPASAASKKTPAGTPAAATPAPATPAASGKSSPYYGDVDTVDAAAKTFTFKSKKGNVRTFHVTEATKITKDSKDGPAADFSIVTVGAYAAGSCKKTADDQYDVVTLHVGAKPAPKTKATPAPKATTATPAPKGN